MKEGSKDRVLLQKLGQNMREIDKDVWVNAVINKVDKCENIVIDDLRLPNEWYALKSKNFTIIRLVIKPTTQLERIKELYPNDWEVHVERLEHITEIALKNYDADYTLECDNLEDLETKLSNILKDIVN